jgi:hypothetical protein
VVTVAPRPARAIVRGTRRSLAGLRLRTQQRTLKGPCSKRNQKETDYV